MRINILISLILMLLNVTLEGQNNTFPQDTLKTKSKIYGIAKKKGDINVIRWAPNDYPTWKRANRHGYVIDRVEITSKGIDHRNAVRLTPTPLKPMSIDQFKKNYDKEDNYAAIAVQSLYGSAISTNISDPLSAHLEQFHQQQALFAYGMLMADAKPSIAIDMGLSFEDRTIDRAKRYVYKIYALVPNTEDAIDTAYCHAPQTNIRKTPSVFSLNSIMEEKKVLLQWNNAENFDASSGYFIERSNDDGKTFQRINDMPFVVINNNKSANTSNAQISTYKVEVEENYKPVKYRVIAFDAFGDYATEGNVITAYGVDKTPPPAPQIKKPEEQGDAMVISWDMPENHEAIQGFIVGHSDFSKGPFKGIHSQMLSVDTRQWIDKSAKNRAEHYYIVSAVDTAGNIGNSIPVYTKFSDNEAPPKPSGLTATVDSSGQMNLTWDASPAEDIKGYYVWFANQADHMFAKLNDTILTTNRFSHKLKLKTLTEEIFYQVVAVDINHNPSDRSDVLKVKKPDIVPPVAPQINAVKVGADQVTIHWNNSPSKDVRSHSLYRKIPGATNWDSVIEIDDLSTISWKDENAKPATTYEYYMIAMDDDGLYSKPSQSVTGRAYVASISDGVQSIQAKKSDDASSAEISWSGLPKGDYKIKLYRATNANKLRLYKSISTDKSQFLDKNLDPETKYRYAIKLEYSTGSSSKMSKEASIVI